MKAHLVSGGEAEEVVFELGEHFLLPCNLLVAKVDDGVDGSKLGALRSCVGSGWISFG